MICLIRMDFIPKIRIYDVTQTPRNEEKKS